MLTVLQVFAALAPVIAMAIGACLVDSKMHTNIQRYKGR
jgi:hypothetical protein